VQTSPVSTRAPTEASASYLQGLLLNTALGTFSRRALVRQFASGGRGSAGEGAGSPGPGTNTNCELSSKRSYWQSRSASALNPAARRRMWCDVSGIQRMGRAFEARGGGLQAREGRSPLYCS
jgi:hypothetical protein